MIRKIGGERRSFLFVVVRIDQPLGREGFRRPQVVDQGLHPVGAILVAAVVAVVAAMVFADMDSVILFDLFFSRSCPFEIPLPSVRQVFPDGCRFVEGFVRGERKDWNLCCCINDVHRRWLCFAG